MEDLYKTLGDAKCVELSNKTETLWKTLNLSDTRKSGQVYGRALEGIVKDFISEFLPARFGIQGGAVFDTETKRVSPQIDSIIYSGVPLLRLTDVVVVEQERVKAIVEVKSDINITNLFGELKSGKSRDPNTYLADDFGRRRGFLPSGARYILFAFELKVDLTDTKVIERLREVCESYAIVLRHKPKIEWETGKENWEYNFDNSVSELIRWLRNLS